MNYFDYEAEDFAFDESFQNWYFKRNHLDIAFWENWMAEHPELKEKVNEAIFIMDNFLEPTPNLDINKINSSWNQLHTLVDEDETASKSSQLPGNLPKWSKRTMAVVTVSLLLVIISAIYIYTNRSPHMVHKTDFGEIISITLPDNSVVTLNSNSTLSYNKWFDSDQSRMVWLEGEAYFSIIPTESKQKFLVKTPDNVIVEVLGTEFNVKQRKGGTKVVLNSGKISLNINNNPKTILMQPGELVAINEYNSDFVKMPVNTDLYTSWKCKLFVFEDTPLSEIIALLEENYGLQVEIDDASLLEQRVSGSVPSDNIQLLMEGLSESFGLSIHRTKNSVKIMKRS